MQKIVNGYFHLLKAIMVFCLAMMVILVFGNVVLRYGFNSGITVSEEISRVCFVFLTFLGAIIGMREHLHLGVDSLVRRLPVFGKKACLVLSNLLMLYATYLFGQGSWQQTVINQHTSLPVSGLSAGLLYGVGVLFAVSVGAIILYDLMRVLAGRVREDELIMVKESEELTELEELQHSGAKVKQEGAGTGHSGKAATGQPL